MISPQSISRQSRSGRGSLSRDMGAMAQYWRAPKSISTFTKYTVFLCVALLFLPKINLVMVDGFRAGLRVDDFIIAIVVTYLYAAGYAAEIIRIHAFKWGVGFVVASWLSHVVGGGSIFFSLRMMEYLCLAIVGYAFGRAALGRDWLAKVLYAYLVANLIICILQATGVVGGIGVSGFTDEFGGRAFGLCNGPWELAIVICFVFTYLVENEWFQQVMLRRVVVYIVCVVVLVLTAARTPMAIFLVLVLLRATRRLPKSTQLASRIIAPVVAFIVLYLGISLVATDNFAVDRLREFLNPENLGELRGYITNFSPSLSYVEASHEDLSMLKDARVDASMAIRLNIFSFMASSYYFGGPLVWLFGLGHGFSGASTDMGLVRILCEVGIVGFVCFHVMMWRCAVEVPGSRMMVVALLINQVTLDVYVGYKTMFVFFLIVGYGAAVASSERRMQARRLLPPVLG